MLFLKISNSQYFLQFPVKTNNLYLFLLHLSIAFQAQSFHVSLLHVSGLKLEKEREMRGEAEKALIPENLSSLLYFLILTN